MNCPPAPSSISEPKLHAEATATLIVSPGDLASALPIEPCDAFPEVLATSRLVALMEIACARLLHPVLRPGELSVGFKIDVTHSAPTPVGALVTASARYVGREGKLFCFEVTATDPSGQVGSARHQRAIIDTARLVRSACARASVLSKDQPLPGPSLSPRAG